MVSCDFSIDEALGFGWRTMTANFLPLIGFGLLAVAIVMVPTYALKALFEIMGQDNIFVVMALSTPVHLVFNTIATMGLIKITLDYCDGKSPEVKDFFSCAGLFLNFLAGITLYFLIMLVGFALFVVPGIIWAIQFQFFRYCIVDRKMGPLEALKMSSDMTRGVKWKLLGFWFLIMLINLAGLLLLVVGIIPAAMVTVLATTFIYRRLIESSVQTTTA